MKDFGNIANSAKGFPDGEKDRHDMAESIADEVRDLRRKLDEVAPGRTRKTDRQRILLMIEVRRWKMGLLNPKKYGKKSKKVDRFDIFKICGIGGQQ